MFVWRCVMEEREIDLKDLIFSILYRWKRLLIAGLIGLVILGGFKLYKSEKARVAAGTEAKLDNAASENLMKKQREIRAAEVKITGKKAEIAKCETAINNDEANAAGAENNLDTLKEQIEQQKKKVAEQERYLDESVLMSIDPYNEPAVRTTYQVVLRGDSEDNAMLVRDPADEIAAAYTLNLSVKEAMEAIADKFGFDVRYADELYSVSTDYDANTVTVISCGTDTEMASSINEAVCKVIESRKDSLSERYWYHSLSRQKTEELTLLDTNLADVQNSRRDALLSARSGLESYEKTLESTYAAIENNKADIEIQKARITDFENDIRELEEDIAIMSAELPGLEAKLYTVLPSKTNSVKNAVKYGLIGFIAGMIVLAGVYCVIYILSDAMHTADEIKACFNIPQLAVFSKKCTKKTNVIDKWIAKLEGKQKKISDEDTLKGVAASVESLAAAGSNVVLLGSKAGKSLVSFADSLNEYLPAVHFSPVADNDATAESIKKLSTADAVILVEERNASSMRAIAAEIEKTKMFGRKILGYIVV